MTIEGNVQLTLEDLQTVEGVNQLNRMLDQLFKTVDDEAHLMSMVLNTDGN